MKIMYWLVFMALIGVTGAVIWQNGHWDWVGARFEWQEMQWILHYGRFKAF